MRMPLVTPGIKTKAVSVSILSAMSLGILSLLTVASSANSRDPSAQKRLGALSLQETKLVFDAVQLKTAECMESHGFNYNPNQWLSTVVGLSETEPPPSSNSTMLEMMSPKEQAAWTKALVGDPPSPDGSNPARTTFEVDGARMSVDLNSCASKGRSAVYGDEVAWMKGLFAAQKALHTAGDDDPNVANFNELQRSALERAKAVIAGH